MKNYPRIFWWILAIIILVVYFLAGAPIHFFKHFFMGTSVGLLVVLYQVFQNRPITQKTWDIPFFFWLFAMFPDVLHVLGYEGHPGQWIDIFLLHNTIDNISNSEWYLGGLTAAELIVYLKLRPPNQHGSMTEKIKS